MWVAVQMVIQMNVTKSSECGGFHEENLTACTMQLNAVLSGAGPVAHALACWAL